MTAKNWSEGQNFSVSVSTAPRGKTSGQRQKDDWEKECLEQGTNSRLQIKIHMEMPEEKRGFCGLTKRRNGKAVVWFSKRWEAGMSWISSFSLQASILSPASCLAGASESVKHPYVHSRWKSKFYHCYKCYFS